MKRIIVAALERACNLTHWVTHHRPLVLILSPCWLAMKSSELDERWGTGRWTPVLTDDDDDD